MRLENPREYFNFEELWSSAESFNRSFDPDIAESLFDQLVEELKPLISISDLEV